MTTIVIPVYAAIEELKQLAKDIEATVPDTPVIMVDDGNVGGSLKVVKRLCRKKPHWNYIKFPENRGFTAAVNAGILAAGGDVVLMNEDIRLGVDGNLDNEWLAKLEEVGNQPNVGVVIPRLRDAGGGLNTTQAAVDRFHYGHPLPLLVRDMGQYKATTEIESGTFAVALIKQECLDEVGVLEESMKVYASDSAFCIMARAKGWKIMRAGEVTLTHLVGQSQKVEGYSYNENLENDTKAFRFACPKTASYHYGANITGPLGYQTGYSRLAYNVARALRKNRVDVRMQPVAISDNPQVSEAPLFWDMLRLPTHQNSPTIFFGTPDRGCNWSRGKSVIATMLEVWNAPPEWVQPMNQVDEVWTFSDWNWRSFRNSGVQTTMRIVPPCIDTDLLHPELTPYNLGRLKNDFTIGIVCEFGERKMVHLLNEVLRVFQGHKDVSIVARIFPGNPGHQQYLSRMAAQTWNTVPIHLINDMFPEQEMGCFYRSCDLILSMGIEGIGMPALEAMACGVPVIGFAHGPGAEFIPPDRCLTVGEGAIVKAEAMCPYYRLSNWALPNPDEFARKVYWAYHHIDELKTNALTTADYVVQEYSLESAGRKLLESLVC